MAVIAGVKRPVLDSAIQGAAIAFDAKPKQLGLALEDALLEFIAAANAPGQGAIAS